MSGGGAALPDSGRLVAIDLGEVRIGVAVSDPGQLVASPADTLHVARGDADAALDAVVEAIDRHEAAGVVVGHPRRMDGREGDAGAQARRFADLVRERTGLPVALWDERLTTVEAERALIAGDVSRAARKGVVDRVAASILLQGVLESRRGGGSA